MTQRKNVKTSTIALPPDPNQSFVNFPLQHLKALTIRVGLESLLRQLARIDADRPGTIHYNEDAHRLEVRWAHPR